MTNYWCTYRKLTALVTYALFSKPCSELEGEIAKPPVPYAPCLCSGSPMDHSRLHLQRDNGYGWNSLQTLRPAKQLHMSNSLNVIQSINATSWTCKSQPHFPLYGTFNKVSASSSGDAHQDQMDYHLHSSRQAVKYLLDNSSRW